MFPLLEPANPKPLTLEMQPDRRMAADRDPPLGAVDIPPALNAGTVLAGIAPIDGFKSPPLLLRQMGNIGNIGNTP